VPRFPPDSFTNLKVLPKNIDQRALLATMRGFEMALGVRGPAAIRSVRRVTSPSFINPRS